MSKILLSFFVFFLIQSCASQPKSQVVPSQAPSEHYVGDINFHPRAKDPAYKTEHPKICFDDAHNNLAVHKGFYNSVLELLESDGYEIVRPKAPFTIQLLRGCKVLFTSASLGFEDMSNRKRASRSSFTDAEIHEIVTWVYAGGSLLVMTDHKPMSNAASRLLGQFKIKGSLAHVEDSERPLAPFTDPGVMKFEGEVLGDHAILKGRGTDEQIKTVNWFYGQALQGPKATQAILKLGKGAKIGGKDDQSVLSTKDYPFGALALNFKKGKVVVFGDATVFTSKLDLQLNQKTGINFAGSDNIQLALNVFHWLSGLLP